MPRNDELVETAAAFGVDLTQPSPARAAGEMAR
jgi:hypothetical protein